eukprot:440269-Amphidinium_carterae.1
MAHSPCFPGTRDEVGRALMFSLEGVLKGNKNPEIGRPWNHPRPRKCPKTIRSKVRNTVPT